MQFLGRIIRYNAPGCQSDPNYGIVDDRVCPYALPVVYNQVIQIQTRYVLDSLVS